MTIFFQPMLTTAASVSGKIHAVRMKQSRRRGKRKTRPIRWYHNTVSGSPGTLEGGNSSVLRFCSSAWRKLWFEAFDRCTRFNALGNDFFENGFISPPIVLSNNLGPFTALKRIYLYIYYRLYKILQKQCFSSMACNYNLA